MEIINLDMTPSTVTPNAHAGQYDASRAIRFMLKNGGVPFTLAGTETITAEITRSDNTEVTVNVANTSSNYVDVIFDDTVCTVKGLYACELRLKDSDGFDIGSKNFALLVQRDPYADTGVHVETVGPAEICTFETNLAEPLQSVIVDVTATGGNGTPDNPIPINGYTEANITACGVNLCFDAYGNKASENTYLYPSGDNLPIIVNNMLRTAYAYVGKNADVVISFGGVPQRSFAYGLEGYPELGTVCHALTVTALTTSSFKVNSGNYEYIAFYYCNDLGNIPSDCQIEIGTTPTTYHAYNGTTHEISLGQTVYGGVLDVTNGTLTVTHTYKDMGTLEWYYPGDYFYADITDIQPNPSWGATSDVLSSYFVATTPNAIALQQVDYAIAIWPTGHRIVVRDTDYSDSVTFTSAMSGVQLVFPLATPVTLTLTPEQIEAIVGVNNVWHDGNGDTEVKYLEVVRN